MTEAACLSKEEEGGKSGAYLQGHIPSSNLHCTNPWASVTRVKTFKVDPQNFHLGEDRVSNYWTKWFSMVGCHGYNTNKMKNKFDIYCRFA